MDLFLPSFIPTLEGKNCVVKRKRRKKMYVIINGVVMTMEEYKDWLENR